MNSFLRIGALVEVVAGSDGSVSDGLLGLAYAASESDFVVVAYNGIGARDIDRVLDRVVARYGIRANGVIYADATDTHSMIDFARRARVVIAESSALRGALAGEHIAFVRENEAAQALARLSRPGRSTADAAPGVAEARFGAA